MQTTDNQDEVFDIVDSDDTVIGQRTRQECNTNPDLIHRSIYILVYNDQNEILWQKRSPTKDVAPGQWVTSVSGHVDAGETYEETAHREIKEELGLQLPLEYLGKFLFRYQNENEFSTIFKAHSNGPFHFNREEISVINFMTVDQLLEKGLKKELKITLAARFVIDALSLD
jgi:isopentenyl-diphosphate Delta-isomerase